MTTELRLTSENKPTDRFQLTMKPMVSPAKCACCGAVDRPVLDFDMTIQFYGAVLLCITCLAEAGRIIGMVPGIELEAAELGATQSLSSQLTQLGMRAITDEQFESVWNIASDLGTALSNINASICPDVGQAVESVPVTQVEGQERLFEFDGYDDAGQPSIISFPDGTTEQDDSSSVSEGPNLVPASNGDGADFFKL